MREILIRHWEHYPRMEAQDLVKLIYQSEFGGGHLIRDPGESLRRLQAEYEAREWGAAEAQNGALAASGPDEASKQSHELGSCQNLSFYTLSRKDEPKGALRNQDQLRKF